MAAPIPLVLPEQVTMAISPFTERSSSLGTILFADMVDAPLHVIWLQ